jgi:hypothetical protein
MEVAASFQRLGLQPDAPASEIRARYRRLSQLAHPDRGGSNELMASLHDAYAIAHNAAAARARTARDDSSAPGSGPGQELVLAQSLALLQAKQLDQLRQDRRDDTERVLQEVVRHQTSALTWISGAFIRPCFWAAGQAGGKL